MKTKVVREIPLPNGTIKVVSLIDGWKEVISYKKKPKKVKKP